MDSNKKALLTQELAVWVEVLRRLKKKIGTHEYMCCIVTQLGNTEHYSRDACKVVHAKINAHLDALARSKYRAGTYNNCLAAARRLQYPEVQERYCGGRERMDFVNYCRMKFCAFNIKQLRKEIAACQ